jgi:hypothetical protein
LAAFLITFLDGERVPGTGVATLSILQSVEIVSEGHTGTLLIEHLFFVNFFLHFFMFRLLNK